jgi:hypothetical protein
LVNYGVVEGVRSSVIPVSPNVDCAASAAVPVTIPLRQRRSGVKTTGLTRYATTIASADSMAWSFRGRHVPGCTASHRTESNCLHFALAWHDRLLRSLTPATPSPFAVTAA